MSKTFHKHYHTSLTLSPYFKACLCYREHVTAISKIITGSNSIIIWFLKDTTTSQQHKTYLSKNLDISNDLYCLWYWLNKEWIFVCLLCVKLLLSVGWEGKTISKLPSSLICHNYCLFLVKYRHLFITWHRGNKRDTDQREKVLRYIFPIMQQ